MCRMYASLMGIEHDLAQITFYEFAARRRREILKTLLARNLATTEAEQMVDFIDSRIKPVTDRRNDFMHHMWVAGGKGRIIRLDPQKTSNKSKQLIYETEASAKSLFLDIATVNFDLQSLMIRHRLL